MHEAHDEDATTASPGALEAAVARAVAESLEVVSGLQARVDTALRALETVAVRARAGVGGDKSAAEVVELFWKELQTSALEAALADARASAESVAASLRAESGSIGAALEGITALLADLQSASRGTQG